VNNEIPTREEILDTLDFYLGLFEYRNPKVEKLFKNEEFKDNLYQIIVKYFIINNPKLNLYIKGEEVIMGKYLFHYISYTNFINDLKFIINKKILPCPASETQGFKENIQLIIDKITKYYWYYRKVYDFLAFVKFYIESEFH